jgi:hypothetical protein
VIDPASQPILQAVLRRESRSFLSYAGAAFPWAAAAGGPALAELHRAVKDEAAAVAALGRFLLRGRVAPPPFGAYPAAFTAYNFVALGCLLPRLVEEEATSIARLEADLAAVGPTARPPLEALLAVKRSCLARLRGLSTAA